MKNRNNVFTATLVALAFALAAVAEAMPRPDGGPTYLADSKRVSATSDAGAKLSKPDDILPIVSISFAPVGLTLSQTARLNLVNMHEALCVYRTANSLSRTGINHSLAFFVA